MCGIAGFFSKPNLTKEQKSSVYKIYKNLLVETQSRGSDATGYAYVNAHGKLVIVKGPITAQKMVLEDKFTSLEENMPQMIIGHTRQATLGTPLDNFNNHPLVVNKEWALIHNGMISNHAELKTTFDLVGKGAVDSEVIAMLIHKNINKITNNKFMKANPIEVAKAINMSTKQLDGGFACAALGANNPDTMYLFNHSNPIVLAYCEELDTIFFASTEMIIKDAIKIEDFFTKKFGVFKVPTLHWTVNKIDDDTLIILKLNKGKTKTESKDDISILSYALTANSRVGKYNNNVYTPPSAKVNPLTLPEVLKPKEMFTGAGTSTSSEELEDWEVGAAVHAGRGGE